MCKLYSKNHNQRTTPKVYSAVITAFKERDLTTNIYFNNVTTAIHQVLYTGLKLLCVLHLKYYIILKLLNDKMYSAPGTATTNSDYKLKY